MNISLTNIRTSKSAPDVADKIIVHGNAGLGKTSLPAFSESPIYLPAIGEESGIAKLAKAGLIPDTVKWLPEISSWEDLLAALGLLIKEKHGHKNVVLDCFDDEGFLSLAYKYHADKQYGGDMGARGFMNFQNGYNTCLPEIRRVTHNAINQLTQKGITVWLLMHTNVDKFKSPTSEDYMRYVPDVNQKYVWPLLRAWADAVLFLDYETFVQEDSKGTAKAKGGETRLLYCQHAATHDAKNRHGLPKSIRLPERPADGYKALMDAMTKKEAG